MKRRSRRRDGGRPVHRGLVIVVFLLLGVWFAGRGVAIAVDARAVARDGRLADAVVLVYRHTPYAGATGRVYIGEPLYRDVPALALRRHDPGDSIKVRYLDGDRFLTAEVGAPVNTDAMLLWLLLGTAMLGFCGWSTRALYREQRAWERLEADLLTG